MSVQNFSFLACLEVAEKFVLGGGWVVCKPILVFSLSLRKAEQKPGGMLVILKLKKVTTVNNECDPYIKNKKMRIENF